MKALFVVLAVLATAGFLYWVAFYFPEWATGLIVDGVK